MRPLLKNIVSKYAKDQRCSNQIGLDTGGLTWCEGSICPVLNAKLMARAASSEPLLSSQWIHISDYPPNFPDDQEPAWMDVKAYIWDTELFPALNTLGYEEQDAKIETMSKWFLSTGLVAYEEEPDLPLNFYTAVYVFAAFIYPLWNHVLNPETCSCECVLPRRVSRFAIPPRTSKTDSEIIIQTFQLHLFQPIKCPNPNRIQLP